MSSPEPGSAADLKRMLDMMLEDAPIGHVVLLAAIPDVEVRTAIVTFQALGAGFSNRVLLRHASIEGAYVVALNRYPGVT